MDTEREAQIKRQIEKVKRDLAALGDLRPGTLSTQHTVCSSPGCHCKADPPIKHGPYYHLGYKRKGKTSTKFIREKNVSAIQKQLKNYQTLKLLVDQWIELATELSNLRLARDRG